MRLSIQKKIKCLVVLQFAIAVGLIVFYLFQPDTQATNNANGRRYPLAFDLRSVEAEESSKLEPKKFNITENEGQPATETLESNKLEPNKLDITANEGQPALETLKSINSERAVNDKQAARKALVKEYCKRMGYTTKPNWENIAVFTYHNILYCVTPKCASRQFRRLFISGYSYGPGEITLERFPDDQRDLMLKTFYKFTVVREPFERLVSAYKDKFLFPRLEDRVLLQRHAEPILKDFRQFESLSARAKDNINKITFKEFMGYLVKKGSNETTKVMDRHWDNYANICGMCAIDYDFIAHYETLDEDLNAFKEATKDRKYKTQLRQNPFNSGDIQASSTSAELIKYYSLIPLEWIKTLGQIYKSSFEMFGYRFPGPLQSLFEANENN